MAISFSAFETVNRSVYKALTEKYDVDVHLVIPRALRIGGKLRLSRPSHYQSFQTTFLDSNGKSGRLLRLRGLAKLIRRYSPTHLLVDSDPASFLVRDVVHAARRIQPKIWAMTAENLERNYLREAAAGAKRGSPYAATAGLVAHVLWRSNLPSIDHVFTFSTDGTKAMSKLGFAGRITKIPAGVDAALFYPYDADKTSAIRHRLGLRSKTIAYFGRLSPEKGIDCLVDALADLRGLPWQLLLDRFAMYETEYGGAVLQRIRSLGIVDRMVSFDAVHEEMPDYMNAADVVILPSIATPKWKEQYGRVIPEAMACGRIVVGSDSGAIPEVLGNAGFLFKSGDSSALAAVLRSILARPEQELERTRRYARERALSHLSIDQQAGVWAEMLRIGV